MTWPTPFDRARIDLTSKRISAADAERQTVTAEELLRRLETQPGIVLADEVGMGKTFVALAVAMSVAWADKGKRPVVIMVPTSVLEKWRREIGVFEELCLSRDSDKKARIGVAKNALEFFRFLDDPASRRVRIILVSHGSFHRALQDPWIKLAILQMALHHAKLLTEHRKSLPRFASDILRTKGSYSSPELFRRLLEKDFEHWRTIIAEYGEDLGDDPIPDAIQKALYKSQVDLSRLRETLQEIPLRKSEYLDDRLKDVRHALNDSFQEIWHEALVNAHFRSPLLILDEAHHVKNPETKLASLFVSEDNSEDAGKLEGALDGGFERMLFLTATPFQLGHDELLHVIDRFQGIDWKSLSGDEGKQSFLGQRNALEASLDEAQRGALELDWHWGKVRRADLADRSEEDWWRAATSAPDDQPEQIKQVIRAERRAHSTLRTAEKCLRPWVIRHLRDRVLPNSDQPRRERIVGAAINDRKITEIRGLAIEDSALLPFMLAARAQAVVARLTREEGEQNTQRATFAEGLSSSYETFLETRARAPEVDERNVAAQPEDARLAKYLDRLQQSLPTQDSFAEHPKIAAVVQRVTDLWEQGEKVVVFCHYRVTGRALVKHISNSLTKRLWGNAAKGLGTSESVLRDQAQLWSDAFEAERPLGRTVREATIAMLELSGISAAEMELVADIVRRFVRTPLYLARYVDLTANDRPAELQRVLRVDDRESLRTRISTFAHFVANLTVDERAKYLAALGRIHPGPQYEPPGEDERHGGAELLPNVRLASGAIRPEVRERLLMGFNTPFFPEVLVASSVMAEGVDLHLNCRHIIHHDLDWNPSVLEQRTGRVDRINSKAERVSKSIEVALPFVGGTQDEKMYRVVMDRERWFQVVMGEEFKTDEYATEKIAERVPLPSAVAKALSLRLDVSVPNMEGE